MTLPSRTPSPTSAAQARHPARHRAWIRRLVAFWTPARLLGLVVLVAAVGLRLADPAPIAFVRDKTFDFYQRLAPRPVETRLVTIVDIDDRSLQDIGQWPWPRNRMAALLRSILSHDPLVVGFDAVFSEPDHASPRSLLRSLQDGGDLTAETARMLSRLPDTDAQFAQAIAAGPVVLGMAPSPTSGQTHGAGDTRPEDAAQDGSDGGAPPPSSVVTLGEAVTDFLYRHEHLLYTLPRLGAEARGHGVFSLGAELDGLVRRVPMAVAVGDEGRAYPALSAEMLRVALGAPTLLLRARRDGALLGVEDMVLRAHPPGGGPPVTLTIPLDAMARLQVYFSRHDPQKYVSAADVLAGRVGAEAFRDRFVLVGTSAVGLVDIKTTPTESFLPGVEVHANVLETLLTGQSLHRPRHAMVLEVWGMIGLGLALIALAPWLGAGWTVVLLTATVGGTVAGSFFVFRDQHALFDPVFPGLAAIAVYTALTALGYAREERDRRRIRAAFSRYMSPVLVERLAAEPGRLTLGGETRTMTLMFCDIRGFTSLSETLDAQGLTRLINRFLTPMTDVILAHGGTIDKYMGDCIMAFWNAPLDDPDHARNACRAALAMTAALSDLNHSLEQEAAERGEPAPPPLKVGIGINTGSACVGNMGSDLRFDYSVLGDTVNLASRLEGQSKVYGVTTVLGPDTAAAVPTFATLALDRVRVVGRSAPAALHALVGGEEAAQTPPVLALVEAQNTFLSAIRAQKWPDARAAVEATAAPAHALGLEAFHAWQRSHLTRLESDPPGAEWDGTSDALGK